VSGERDELETFKRSVREDVKTDVDGMLKGATAHIERIVKPVANLEPRIVSLEEHNAKQTPILERLEVEAKRAKKARIASTKERIKRSAQDETWRTWRKRLVYALSLLIIAGEAYRAWWPK